MILDIMYKLSRGNDLNDSKEILENDTERKGRRTKNSQISNEYKRLDPRKRARGFGEFCGSRNGLRIRIEHQSLILAQDERWRRA